MMIENITIDDLTFVSRVNNFNDLTLNERIAIDIWYNERPLVKSTRYFKKQDNGLNEYHDKFLFDYIRYYLYCNKKIDLSKIIAIANVSHECLKRNILQCLYLNDWKNSSHFFSNCIKTCYPVISESEDYYTILVDEFEGMVCEIMKCDFQIEIV